MIITHEEYVMTLAERLRSERRLLRLSQAQLAVRVGIRANAQGLYEKGVRSPRADYLGRLASLGMDVQFIILGVRVPVIRGRLSDIESEIIQGLRSLDAEDRQALEQIMGTMARYMMVETDAA